MAATKERADLEKSSQLHNSINLDGQSQMPQTISEALHKNADVGLMVIKERAERNLREYADMKALKMKGRLQRAQMYANKQMAGSVEDLMVSRATGRARSQ